MQIDSLEIMIKTEAKNANAELDSLISKLTQVQGVLGKQTKGFTGLSNSIKSTQKTTKNSTGRMIAGFTKIGIAVHALKRTFDLLAVDIKESIRNR